MNIITKEPKEDRLTDGINTILSLSEEDFNNVIEKLKDFSQPTLENILFYYTTDKCENPSGEIQLGLEKIRDEEGNFIGRSYYGASGTTILEVFNKLKNIQEELPKESDEYNKISKLIETRNLNSYKNFLLNRKENDRPIVNKVFEILSNEEEFQKFLNYDANKEHFSIDSQDVGIEKYLSYLGKAFGNKDENGNLSNKNDISKNFYILQLDQFKEKYSTIFDQINLDRYVNKKFTFEIGPELSDNIVRYGDEPNWDILPETYKAIMEDMPPEMSLEEKAIYIYCKMCKIFSYDEGYLYRDKINKVNYDSTFSSEHLEKITPGTKITCYDFSRIYAKLINELDGDISGVMILSGANEGHALAGFYTKNVSATVEAINIANSKDSTNDLMKAKNGINLKGIKVVSDRDGLIEKAINTVYPEVLGKEPLSIKQYVSQLKEMPIDENIQNDSFLKLQSFLEIMKARKIYGNEFVQTLWGMSKAKYFGGSNLERAHVGELKVNKEGNKKYKRHILLRRQTEENEEKEVYDIDTENLSITQTSPEEVISKLNSGELVYESKDHKLEGIDKEVSR